MMPPFVVFPTNRIAHFVEVSLYLFYLAQQVKLKLYISLSSLFITQYALQIVYFIIRYCFAIPFIVQYVHILLISTTEDFPCI